MNNERDCKHGQLARSCEICGLEAENAALKATISRQEEGAARLGLVGVAMRTEIDALRAELAAIRAAPIFGFHWRRGWEWGFSLTGDFNASDKSSFTALYAAPGAKQGWKLCPIEPTDAMLQADVETDAFIGIDDARKLYSAMIAAASGAKP